MDSETCCFMESLFYLEQVVQLSVALFPPTKNVEKVI